MQSLGRKQTMGYAGGVIGSGVNAKDYHKPPPATPADCLAQDSLDTMESPLQNDSLLSNSKAQKQDFKMDDILIEMNMNN